MPGYGLASPFSVVRVRVPSRLAKSKLVARSRRHVPGEINLQHLLAMDRGALFIGQTRDDLACSDFDDLPRGRIGVASINAERDPARLVAQQDGGDLLGGHYRIVEKVQAAVGRVRHPELLFVWRQADAVAGAAMPLGWSF